MEPKALRVGIYARISEDRDGRQTATARQRHDCQAYADLMGWEVVDHFEDIDISAYSLKAIRPQFERMLEAIGAGEIDGFVVWKLDRLARQHRDLARVFEACAASDSFFASVKESINSREASGQLIAEVLTSVGRMESSNISLRQQRKALEQRELGLAPTNGKRCFGYDRRYTAIVSEEAAIVREVRDRLFAGESQRGVCLDLERRGVTGTDGVPWRAQAVKRYLTTATIAGFRELNGVRYPGKWPAIISESDMDRLRGLLNQRPTGRRQSPARKYLLTGYIRCGRCGGRMFASPRANNVAAYVCRLQPGYENCGKMSVKAEPVEALVFEMLVAALDDEALAVAMASRGEQDDGLADALKRDQRSLEELTNDYYVDHRIGREEFFVARAGLEKRLEANRLRLARRDGRGVLVGFIGEGSSLRRAWEKGTLDWRRSVVGALLDRVIIEPGRAGRNAMNPDRVKPVWRY
jgi:DNA invertase Pin-like site-specific DNA recombinase